MIKQQDIRRMNQKEEEEERGSCERMILLNRKEDEDEDEVEIENRTDEKRIRKC